MKYLFTLILILTLSLYVTAQPGVDSTFAASSYMPQDSLAEGPEETANEKYQDEEIPLRNFNQHEWEKITGDKDFTEERVEEEAEETPTNNNINYKWLLKLLRIAGYILAAAIAGYLLYLVQQNVSFKKKKIKPPVNLIEDEIEDIKDVDISQLLKKALDEKNYRLAIRLYFVNLLKILQEKEQIKWEKDKTNRDYLSELSAKNFFFSEIRTITRTYELIWYGEHELSSEAMLTVIQEFEIIQEKINTSIRS